MLNNNACDEERLPNLIRVEAAPVLLAERVLAFVRQQAFEGHLKRLLKSLESEGVIDPQTGLLETNAFWQDLDRAVDEAADAGRALSIARFSFEGVTDGRSHLDAARLFSRLVRNIDFACREQDGSILAAFTEPICEAPMSWPAGLRAFFARPWFRPVAIAAAFGPTITLATFKPTDNVSTLVARVGAFPKVAAARPSRGLAG